MNKPIASLKFSSFVVIYLVLYASVFSYDAWGQKGEYPHFNEEQILQPEDLENDARHRQMNDHLTPDSTDPSSPVRIDAGIGLDAAGREIIMQEDQQIDLNRLLDDIEDRSSSAQGIDARPPSHWSPYGDSVSGPQALPVQTQAQGRRSADQDIEQAHQSTEESPHQGAQQGQTPTSTSSNTYDGFGVPGVPESRPSQSHGVDSMRQSQSVTSSSEANPAKGETAIQGCSVCGNGACPGPNSH